MESTNRGGAVSMTTGQGPGPNLPRSVSVLGAGAWGTTLAILAAEAGHRITLIAHSESTANYLDHHRSHPTSLPGISIPSSIQVTFVGKHRLQEADVVVISVPTQKLRQSLLPIAEALRERVILSVVKGLELD